MRIVSWELERVKRVMGEYAMESGEDKDTVLFYKPYFVLPPVITAKIVHGGYLEFPIPPEEEMTQYKEMDTW